MSTETKVTIAGIFIIDNNISDELWDCLEAKVFTPILTTDFEALKVDNYFIERLCEGSESLLEEVALDTGMRISVKCKATDGRLITLNFIAPNPGEMIIADKAEATYMANGYNVTIVIGVWK